MRFDARHLDESSDRPLVKRVADRLRDRISRGELEPGAALASTQQLGDEFGASLNTIKGAVNILIGEGLLVGGRGRPYRVRQRPRLRYFAADKYQRAWQALTNGDDPVLFTHEFDCEWDAYSAEVSVQHTIARPKLAEVSGWAPDAAVIRRSFIDKIDQVAVQLRLSVVLATDAEGMLLADEHQQPVRGGVMAELHHAGLLPDWWRQHWHARHPTTAEALYLDVGERTPVWEISRVFRRSGRAVEVAELIVPCDRVVGVQEGWLS